jgi:hypothetical protein
MKRPPKEVFSKELRNPVIEAKLAEIAKTIGGSLPDGWGFTLLLFEYKQGGSLFYTSSAQRAGIIATMREFITRFGIN